MPKGFTDDDLAMARALRTAEIRVVEGRLTIWFQVSDEYAARTIHDLMRPAGSVRDDHAGAVLRGEAAGFEC